MSLATSLLTPTSGGLGAGADKVPGVRPLPILKPNPNPFPGNGNRRTNWNRHIVYEFSFIPSDIFTPILKYGISDFDKWDFDRPELQLPYMQAKWGPTAKYKILFFTPDRQMALDMEKELVEFHKTNWGGSKPREQILP